MLEIAGLQIREATEFDLSALEWDGEYVHFRRVYQEAMKEVKKGRRVIFIAEADTEHIGQIFVNLLLKQIQNTSVRFSSIYSPPGVTLCLAFAQATFIPFASNRRTAIVASEGC
jgi:hypothetical protein